MVARYGFPKQEPQFYTVLTLSKYSRPRPGSTVNSATEVYVRLPMPDQLTDNYGMEINSTALGLAGMADMSKLPTISDLISGGKSIAQETYNSGGANITRMINRVSEYAASVAPGVVDKIMNTNPANVLALTPGVSETIFGRAAQLETGMVRNPHMTTIFDGVKLREFQFTWKLSPKTPEEADEMSRMITEIKKYMHPEIKYAGFAYDYPYLAEVNFIGGSTTNTTLPSVGKSFISALSVNNLTSGVPAFYTDGRPVTIELSLQLNEVNVKTRQDFAGS